MGRLFLIIVLLVLPLLETVAQNNPFSPLRIFVTDSNITARDFKSIGNINADSFEDYTYRLISQSNTCGKQQMFRGDSVLDTIPIYELPAGYGLATFVKAGDLNGDGYNDFLTTPSPPACPYLSNQVTVYWGTSTGIDTTPNRLLPFPVPVGGGLNRDEVISNVDVNGDGYRDVLLLSIRDDSGNAVFLFKGKQGGVDSLPSWKISTPPFFLNVLREISSMDAGDLNRDGFDDILVGKHAHSTPGQDSISGIVEIYFGGATLDSIPNDTLTPPTFSNGFGNLLNFLRDLNDDGWPEFSVNWSTIYSCPPVINWQPSYQLPSGAADVGDVNGDGYLDIMIGFATYPPPFGFGGVLFYLGGPRFDTIPDAVITDQDLPPDFLENIGTQVGFIGDINGDGAEEFMFLADRIIPYARDEVFMFAGNTTVKTDVTDGGKPQIPWSFELFQNYPNPFNSTTLISYTLSRRTRVRLEIFNIAGQLVKVLVGEEQSAGGHRISWEGKDSKGRPMPSGIYLYKLSFEGDVQVKKMVLVK